MHNSATSPTHVLKSLAHDFKMGLQNMPYGRPIQVHLLSHKVEISEGIGAEEKCSVKILKEVSQLYIKV